MTDRAILFNSPMVCAILDGRKTQTRRAMTPQPEHKQVHYWKGKHVHDSAYRHWCWKQHVGYDNWDNITVQLRDYLPIKIGDRLWVRESWRCEKVFDHKSPSEIPRGEIVAIHYEADGTRKYWKYPHLSQGRLRPSIHMPKWASRLTLIVTDVYIHRLQDIDEKEAISEGIYLPSDTAERPMWKDYFWGGYCDTAALSFLSLWDSIYGHGQNAGVNNPWVIAVKFDVVKTNINEIPHAR